MNYKKHNHKKVMRGKGRKKRINKRKQKPQKSLNSLLKNSFNKKLKRNEIYFKNEVCNRMHQLNDKCS